MSDHDALCAYTLPEQDRDPHDHCTCDRLALARADERERRGNNCRGMWEEWLVDLRKRIKELPITRTQALSHGWDSVGLNEVLALLDEEGGGDE